MAGVKPSKSNFLFWLPMQEAGGGIRYDATGNGYNAIDPSWAGWGPPLRASGHVQQYSADFEESSLHNMYIPDASWQSGDSDKSFGGWFYLETFNGILMSKGGNDAEVCNYIIYNASSRIYFMCGDDGSEPSSDGKGYNSNYPMVDTSWSPSTGTWYYVICRHDASANTSYINIWNTAGSQIASDSTPLYATWSTNNSGYGIFFGSSGNQTYSTWPISVNSDPLDGRLEQWFMYNGFLSTDNMTWLVNGGIGRTWAEIAGAAGRKFQMGKLFWKNWEKIFRPEKSRILTLPERAVVPI